MGRPKQDINNEVNKALKSMYAFGEKSYQSKKDGTRQQKIHSYSTARVYNKECQKFADYVKEVSPTGRNTSLEDARQYAKDYIQKNNDDENISAYTVKLMRSALAKLYQTEGKEFGEVRERNRADIDRSRNRTVISEKTGKVILNQSKRAGHFSEKNHKELVEFCLSTGLRRTELESLKGNQLHQGADGRYYLNVTGKGGRNRDLLIRGDVQAVVDRCRQAGDNIVWDKVPKAMDVHHYRSQYATALYKELARDINDVPRAERFYCRGDLKGVVYDRKAMLEVSESLGHSRESVIAEHYLRE